MVGMPHAAAQVLERLPDAADILSTRALWQARSGAWAEALRSTEGLHERRDLTQRARLLGEVVRVWALHTQGQHTSAEECFRRAAHIAWESGQRRAFHLVPAGVLRAVGGSAVEELCPGLGDPGLNGASGSHGTFTEEGAALSPRENDVLAALHEHAGPTGISRSLGISANTVKTHLRNIYRKLGASGRDEALRLSGGPRRDGHG